MQYECIFVRIREILPIGVDVSGILAGADSTKLQALRIPLQGSGFIGGMKRFAPELDAP